MNDPGHNNRLLADVLGERISADFREGLLNETLRLVRRRQRFRQVRAAASALAVLAALGLLIWHQQPSSRVHPREPAKPYRLVRTQPLPRKAWVETRPFPSAGLVASVPTQLVVQTAKAGASVREINDEELLALVRKPAALVRYGPQSAELVFVNAEDQEELLRN